MEDIKIIDNYMDDREFRNYVNILLLNLGYKHISIDDARIADDDILNNNDMLVVKDGKKYTVQTFLNEDITEKQVEETIVDMMKENVDYGIIVSNKIVSDEMKKYALNRNVVVLDRDEFKSKL